MQVRLKPLSQQVILITGASSGIGRQSAVRFGEAGARLILIARNEDALQAAVKEVEEAGGEAMYAVADVADLEQFRAAADAGVQRFGRIDTWINNAGTGIYSKLIDSDLADDRRLFETNFWGVVHGSRLAVGHLLKTGGGALINVGSSVADTSAPIHGMYATSKFAVKGFTDALRYELMHDKLPISVTQIKPSAINTPFPRHAKNYFNQYAKLPPPLYNVDLVADQILHAAEHGGRDLYAGGTGWLLGFMAQHFPSLSDIFVSRFMVSPSFADRPEDHSNEGLHATRGFHQAEGDIDRDHHERQGSVYGVVRRNPIASLAVAAVGLAVVGLVAKSIEDDR